MIRFIDITTGNVFNGSKPYVFWFDKEQSVNLNYIRKICVLSDKKTLNINIPENDVFCLLDTDKMGDDIERGGKKYKDLNNSGFKTFSCELNGASYKDFYVYMIYVLGMSQEGGEFRESLFIDDEEFTVGADFYNESESLSINLANKGFEIPKDVEKAIYDYNVHEDADDNILLNRKYKELLNEYINILGNKGSYRSLLNSLDWFEYGDLLKIYEYWRHQEPNRPYLVNKDVEQVITTDISDMMTKAHKTTYIGIYYALTRAAIDEYGDIKYKEGVPHWDERINKEKYGEEWESATTTKLLTDKYEVLIPDDAKDRLLQIGEDKVLIGTYPNPFIDKSDKEETKRGSNWLPLDKFFDQEGNVITRTIPEPTPEIASTVQEWDSIDLSLKMSLLGSFYSTYFMPLHLDLIHSTVENIIYTNTIKIFRWNVFSRADYFRDVETFTCSIKDEDKLYITNVKARVYNDTTFGELYDGTQKEYKDFTIFGVEETNREKVLTEDEQKTFLAQYFEGPGCIVPFECTFHNIQKGTYFNEATIIIYHNNTTKCCHTYNINNIKEEIGEFSGTRHINFSILLRERGNYQFTIDFRCVNGKHYIKKVSFTVSDDINQTVKMYRIKKRGNMSMRKYDSLSDESTYNDDGTPNLLQYMFSQLDNPDNNCYHQFITASTDGIKSKIGLNQVIVFEPNAKCRVHIMDPYGGDYGEEWGVRSEEFINTPDEVDASIKKLADCASYKFFKQKRITKINDDGTYEYGDYVIGINNNFSYDDICYLVKDKKVGIFKNGKEHTTNISIFTLPKYDVGSLYINIKESNPIVKTQRIGKKDLDIASQINPGHIALELPSGKNWVLEWNNSLTFNFRLQWDKKGEVYKDVSFDIKQISDDWDSLYIFKISPADGEKNTNGVHLMDKFIPLYHTLEEVTDREIEKDDVVCFLPDLKMIKNADISTYKTYGWKFTNVTTGKAITPSYEDKPNVPVNPILGRYDIKTIVDPGYYDVTLKYELSDNCGGLHYYKSKSSFIVKK